MTDDPTPEDIKAICEQIQETWSDAERRVRAGSSFEEPVFAMDRRHRFREVQVPQSDVDW